MRKLVFLILPLLFMGCSGLSQQYRATTEGMKIVYSLKENENLPNKTINLTVFDERINKDVIGDGAKSTVGEKFIGYFSFGILYAFSPDSPTIQGQTDMTGIFNRAYTERLTRNGMKISTDNTADYNINILIRSFNLDIHFGTWTGEVGYIAKLQKNSQLLCEKTIYEKRTKWNTFGYGSGETAISDAFNSAINNFDIATCISRK